MKLSSAIRQSFIFLMPLFTVYSLLVTPVHAQEEWATRDSRCLMPGTDVATIQGFECLFYNILQVIVMIAGLAFLFMFISGGFQYLMSQGDGKKTAAAQSTLTMSIIGLVGVVASFLILKLITTFTGVDVTQFNIPGGP